ncbi:SymE family type I addiction module toxin [Chitinophaga barathri]|uniref:Type I addiction module toxin, SymE family n=1 Tax=Chitinophaga barathri TaxID=1647451 RepID=A0A3N4MLB2_9BACT|nr:SymE family type I addiction module toxin [Chitinophaga barathri]RPD42849.1 type I addiction module toxin, SymE family [Chitinophaga barathri]RPD42856.1 type I addiction module toxin, SymE family [Chitinophaga barathri]
MVRKVNNMRLIKVGAKAHPRDRGDKYLPWLNLSGVWLAQAGFAIGDQLEITVSDGYLEIKNLSTNGDQRA